MPIPVHNHLFLQDIGKNLISDTHQGIHHIVYISQ